MLGFMFVFFAVFANDLNLIAFDQATGSFDYFDLIFPQQELDPFAHAFRHPTAAGNDSGEIRFEVASLNSVIRGMFKIFKYLGAFQQGFGWNTSPIKTNA